MSGRARIAVAMGLAAATWLPLLALAALQGAAALHAFFVDLPMHVRFLFAVPFLYALEPTRYRHTRSVVRYLDEAAVVRAPQAPRFDAIAATLERWEGAAAAPIVLALLAFAGSALGMRAGLAAGAPAWIPGGAAGLSLAGWWLAAVSQPIWLFLLLRWILAMLLWWRFLWSVSRLDLRLVATHPDGRGGIGILSIAQMALSAVALPVSAMLSAQVAVDMLAGRLQLGAVVPDIVAYFVFWGLLFVVPLMFFTPHLIRAKREGLIAYGKLGEVLFGGFHDKWAALPTASQRELLGNVDPSSLADYGYAYEVLAGMRPVPAGRSDFIVLALFTVVPFLPLLLIQYSVGEILTRLLGGIS
ncbi:MAG TPA: hypothetical protein VF876_00230 [Burkholderiales bacterium]